jgi:REP element-mobilizing transposase RayT
MGLPRSHYVQEGEEGVYHCYSRCVRRAFLFGFDALTRRDFSHRKAWLVDRLRYLASIFAIEVCAYAVMITHYHSVLRTRPDLAALWSDCEVATRWLTLFPRHRDPKGVPLPPTEKEIRALTDLPDRIAELRKRLCSLSWFMGRLNEFIARAANLEDQVKGRFWESRFKCQALLDEAAIAACMAYVDLNPIRAGVAETPEDSDFTSIQERIRAWGKEMAKTDSHAGEMAAQAMPSGSIDTCTPLPQQAGQVPEANPDSFSVLTRPQDAWLCPIQSEPGRRGILEMTTAEYIDLVDRSGRLMRPGKRGAIDPELEPILLRIGANPDAWLDTVSRFGPKFRLAAGLASSLRSFAERLGRRWFQGAATARIAFGPTRPQLA